MHALLNSGERVQYRIGALYNHILNNRLAEKAGYRYARELFAKEFKDVAQSTLSSYGAVASTFDEEIVGKYHVTVLGRLITYLKAPKLSLPDGDPGEIPMKVPQKNGTTVEKKFADCARSDLLNATKLLAGPPQAMPDTDTQRLEQLHDALRSGVGHASKIELKAAYDENKGTTVSLTNVGLNQLQQVLAILLNAQQASDDPTQARPVPARAAPHGAAPIEGAGSRSPGRLPALRGNALPGALLVS